MPKVSEHNEAHLRRIIRDAMALDPLISMQGIRRVVEQKINRQTMSDKYIKRLVQKVTGEMAVVADREKVEERITYLRERNRMICEELLRMAFPPATMIPQPAMIDRRKALEAIATIESRQIKLEMDLGLFTRHLGEVDINHRHSVAFDEKSLETIVQTFQAWSTPPQMRRIEPQRMIEAKATVITNEPPKPTAKPISAPIPAITGAGLVPTE